MSITRRSFVLASIGGLTLPSFAQDTRDQVKETFLGEHFRVFRELQSNNDRLTGGIAGQLAITSRVLATYGRKNNWDMDVRKGLQKADRNTVLITSATPEAIANGILAYGLNISRKLRQATPVDPRDRDQILDDLLSGHESLTMILNQSASILDHIRPSLVADGIPKFQKAQQSCYSDCSNFGYVASAAQQAMYWGCAYFPWQCDVFIGAWLAAEAALGGCHLVNYACGSTYPAAR